MTGLSANDSADLIAKRNVLVSGSLGNERTAGALEGSELVGKDGLEAIAKWLKKEG